jgi:GAF domain-containing protein
VLDTDRLAALLATIAQTLITDYGIAEVLLELCEQLAELVEVDAAAVVLADGDGHLQLAAASDERAALLNQAQADAGEGPAVTAFRDGEVVVAGDLAGDPGAFPVFAAAAAEIGVGAMVAFPMEIKGRRVGTLVLHRARPGGLHAAAVEAGQTLAASAAAYVLNARALDEATTLADQLRTALESRVLIEQAKGMLAEQLGLDPASAFPVLRDHARRSRQRLVVVAEEVVAGRLVLRDPAARA